jgi:nitroreductase
MNIMDYIFKRRSIRKYNDKEVDKETLVLLLKAAMAAPTACNNQPWEFIVVDDKDMMSRLRKELYAGQYNAPAAIVVCGNMNYAFSGPGHDYWIQDCSAAMENILLAASGMELGAVWIGLYPIESAVKPVCKVLNIPEHIIPLGVVYIGYPDEFKEPRTKYNEKVVYWQKYDSKRKHRARPKNMKHL